MSDRLQYEDYQNFMKSLREHVTRNALTPEEVWALRIPAMVTGEYGEKTKRPHWHILLFNYEPDDMVYLYTSDRGDKLYKSKFIDELWGKNDPKKTKRDRSNHDGVSGIRSTVCRKKTGPWQRPRPRISSDT